MEKDETEKEPESVLKARTFYRSCMNLGSLKTLLLLNKYNYSF